MSGLQSMLMPLETLPGWPAAPDPTVIQLLLLLVAAPLAVGLVIAGASYLATTRDLSRFGPPVNPTTTFVGAPGVETASDEVPAGIEAKPGADVGTGGTSARW